ncbi:MAG: hypothetical protein M1829_002649 [Trizodia sp. TS-e1964]|nr:MAG: hypothetical protein M1829_002649 [Trizodia sp. TS-e1964]
MSQAAFSNTSTGSKPADPYKAKNIDHAELKEKVEDLLAFIEASKFGMMTTRQGQSGLLASRCMALAGKENGVDLIFHTNTESGKTDDLASDNHINISFLNSSGEWASISGHAAIITDREVVKKHYSPALKAWLGDLGDGVHDGGVSDPRIGIIKVTAVSVTYAVVRRNAAGRAYEIAKGVVTGAAPSVNKLREIDTDELGAWRSAAKLVN